MKHFTLIIVVLLASAISPVWAQSDLAGLWEYGLLNPERFDDYVSRNRASLQSSYNGCLNYIYNSYFPQAQRELERCRSIAGYGQNYMDCINKSPATFAVVSSQTLYQVINGQTRWVDTIYGQSALQVKNMAPIVGLNYNAWVQIYMSFAAQIMQCP